MPTINNKSGTKKSWISVDFFLLCFCLFIFVCFLYMCGQAHVEVNVNIRISASILSSSLFLETSSPASSVLPSTEVTDVCRYTWLFFFFFLNVGDPNSGPHTFTVRTICSKPSSRAPKNDFFKKWKQQPDLVDHTWNHSTWESWDKKALSLRSAWAAYWALVRLHSESLAQKKIFFFFVQHCQMPFERIK